MKSRTILFFAVQADLRPVLQAVEAKIVVHFVECGMFDSDVIDRRTNMSAFPELGIAKHGNANLEDMFLVLPGTASVVVRPVPQRRGGLKYAIDQIENPGTVVLRPGGAWGDSAVIQGMVGSVHGDPIAKQLMAFFSKEIKTRFTNIKGVWVGDVALQLLDSGMRLSAGVSSPREYDLAR